MSADRAVIGGSTGYRLIERLGSRGKRIGPVDTPFGDSAPVYEFPEFLYISRHGESGYQLAAPFVNYRANIWALKELGVKRIIAWSGPAAIDAAIGIGEIVLPADVIDETRGRNSTFFEGTGWGFVRQNPVFCPRLRGSLRDALSEGGTTPRTGEVYVCTQGPRLETPAEVRKFAACGATLVGMTLSPEVFLARELEMCYAAICYVTNYAEGVRERPFRPGVLFEGLLDDEELELVEEAASRLPAIAARAFELADQEGGDCHCSRLMERYRRRGDIGEDWHSWIGKRE